MTLLKTTLRWLLAGAMLSAGVQHFVHPAPFVRIVPRGLPRPALLVAVSGAAEIAGGAGLLVPDAATQQAAAWGLIALYVAVFPANINMATNRTALGLPYPAWLLWLRLPLQGVLIAWAHWFTRKEKAQKKADDPPAVN